MRSEREQEKILSILEKKTRLLDTVNTAAAILLANKDMAAFESALLKCFDLVGHCLDVDRVQIWRNEVINNEPHFVLRYEWLSDFGKTCSSAPIGLSFPYSEKKEWAQKFLYGDYINAPLVNLLEDDRDFLGKYDMKSIVIIPMFLEGDFWGFFCINDCRNERTFSEEEISILTSAGLMMTSAINRNIQNIKMREEEERTQIAEASSRAKSDFLARMSHEIRTPMNAILGITEIQLQNETHSKDAREAFEKIYNSSDLLLGIINDILDLSKIEAGRLELNPVKYDIASLIHDTVQMNIMRYENKMLDFILTINENLPLYLFGDELRIKQILNNILSNAFKYTAEGSVRMTIYAEPAESGSTSTRTIVFVVSDTGQGMTADQVKKLGTEYSRFNMEANRKTEGTGLGMNITRNLINQMNGTIHIESTPGSGSVFTVRLPQKIMSSEVIGKELAENLMKLDFDSTLRVRAYQMNRDYMPYGRVLIVDDMEINLYVAKGLMSPYGLTIDTATSGFEAIDKIKNGKVYDIVFMDHMMPKMDGMEATKRIREWESENLKNGKHIPIVALTANAFAGQAEMFLKNGFDEYLSKPIDTRRLNLILNKMIRDKQPLEVIEAANRKKNSLPSGEKGKKHIDSLLAEYFVRDAKKAIAVLEEVFSDRCRKPDDVSMLIVNVHAMKSALANIGETELSAEAFKLEQAGRENNIKLILSEMPAFLERLNRVVEKLEPKEDSGDQTDDAANFPYLKEKLLEIKEACAVFDKKTAKKALEELRQRTWSHQVKEKISAIAEYLLHSEFDEAVKEIESLIRPD